MSTKYGGWGSRQQSLYLTIHLFAVFHAYYSNITHSTKSCSKNVYIRLHSVPFSFYFSPQKKCFCIIPPFFPSKIWCVQSICSHEHFPEGMCKAHLSLQDFLFCGSFLIKKSSSSTSPNGVCIHRVVKNCVDATRKLPFPFPFEALYFKSN